MNNQYYNSSYKEAGEKAARKTAEEVKSMLLTAGALALLTATFKWISGDYSK